MNQARARRRGTDSGGALGWLLTLLVGALATPLPATGSHDLDPRQPLGAAERQWVESTLAAMTLEQKAGQLVMPKMLGLFQNPRSEGHQELIEQARRLQVGGFVLSTSEVETAPRLLAELQAVARVPLIVAADAERSMAFRVARGTVPLPFAMAIGATGSPEAARFAGEVTAREARAMGVHWVLAPVADINNDPANPVINLRSFGEDPEAVASLVAAFVEGAQAGGVLATAKHFPGHGDTETDSHLGLPVLTADLERLEALELVPFRRAIESGVGSVMTGHLALPALDPSGAPASLSPTLTHGLLRERLGFAGLTVTDALDMAALAPAWAGEAALRAIQAGADVLLMPGDPKVATQSLVRAVAEGELTEERLEASVRRLLEAKARLGLHQPAADRVPMLADGVALPADLERAAEIAASAITLVRHEGGVLPLRVEDPLELLHLTLTDRLDDPWVQGIPKAELEARRIPVTARSLGPEVTPATLDELAAAAGSHSHVIVSSFVRGSPAGGPLLSPSQRELLGRLGASGTPLALISFGTPYLLPEVPEVPVFVCAYGAAPSSQRAAVAALLGEASITGRLPVSLPAVAARGHGLELPRRDLALRPEAPEQLGFRPGAMAELDAILDALVERGAFPGGVVAVGHRGGLAHLRPFGRLSWAEDAPPVTTDTLYDLASLTKVIATTTMAMILVDEGRLHLETPVHRALPRFRGGGKEEVTVTHLLTHSSGLDWWAPLYQEAQGRDAFLERIYAMDLVYEPGSQSLYSDLGVILLWEVLERVAGEGLESFVRRRLFEPLGMKETRFRPPAELLPRIAPTEEDPWRGRLVHGEVHDENAHALGGVAPHAGLFGTAEDLARFAQMILWGGVYDHHRIASRSVVERFTTRAGNPDSTRALGWDTKSATGSSAGELLSPRSFGHTGFTGTSLWIDPERELFVILLTNRVHPTRENLLIREARPAVADAVVRGLETP